jgi:hypothetical protein
VPGAALRERPFWVLLAAVGAFFWRPLTTGTFFFRDLYLLFYGRKLFWADAIRSGQIPLWDPFLHGGQPFLAEPANSTFYPTNALFLILPPLTAFNVNLVLHFVLCAGAMYFLARVIGISQAGAFVAGAVYALCGYVLSSANLMVLLQALPWAPLLLAAAHLSFTDGRRRWFVIAAIAGALPLLSGAAEMAAMSFAMTGLWCVVVPKRVSLLRRVTGVAAIFAFSIGLSFAQTIPAFEVIRNSTRAQKIGFNAFAQWSVSPNRLPELVVPGFFGPTDTLSRDDYWGARHELGFPYILSIYFGAVTVLLAAVGARKSALLTLCSIAGITLSLGGYLSFFEFLYDYVPLIGIFRFPVKALQLVILPMALLAGHGVDALPRARRGVIAAAAVLAAAFGGVALAFAASDSFRAQFTSAFFGRTLTRAAAHELALSLGHPAVALIVLLLLLVIGRRRNVAGAVAALVFVDLAWAGARVNAYASRELFEPPPLAAKVRALLGPGEKLYRAPDPFVVRLRVPSQENVWLAWWDLQLLSRYTGATFGIPVVFHNDYDGLAPVRIKRMTDALARMDPASRLSILAAGGARALLVPDKLNSSSVRLIEQLRGADGNALYLYENLAARGVRFVPAGCAAVRTSARTNHSWTVEVAASCPGQVVFAETYYPGWKAEVDGRPARITLANGAFSSVEIPAGRHVVVKTYRPRLPLFGAAGTLLAVVFLAAAGRIRGPRRPEFTAPTGG